MVWGDVMGQIVNFEFFIHLMGDTAHCRHSAVYQPKITL